MFDRSHRNVLVACASILGTAAAAVAQPCVLPDNGGTVVLPDPSCPYLSPDDFHMVVDGLPAGTTIVITGIHRDFICKQKGVPQEFCNSPGGALGGETEFFDSTIEMNMQGTGLLAGFSRVINVPINCIAETGPRTLGDPVQTFPNEMVQLQGAIFGDPDFDILAVRAGRNFGLPSPGETTLTSLGDGTFNVDSFFDVFYEIDFQGAPGSILEGFAGTTQGIVRMQAGEPASGGGDCELEEGFDTYVAGANVVDQSNWEPWLGDPTLGNAIVVPSPNLSPPHAIEIDGTDDIVHQFFGINSGRWVFTARQFVPDTFTGQSFFILLNTYPAAPNSDWSTQILFDGDLNQVQDFNSTATLPLFRGTWVEIRVEFDLDHDLQSVFYNGQLLFSDSWKDHVAAGGALNLAAVDLFNNGGTVVYYDELSLCINENLCPTDVDGDGETGFQDLLQLLAEWGPYAPCPPYRLTDFDLDCDVGFQDLLLLLSKWGPCIICEEPNVDIFATAQEVDAPTQIELGSPAIPPLPPDFFEPGSDPFFGQVPLGGFVDDHLIDTRVLRNGPVNFPGAGFPRPSDPVQVEIIELQLTGVEPIVVTSNGGQDPEEWIMAMGLSNNQVPGVLDAILESPDGGLTQAIVPVKPRLAFAPLQDLQLLEQGIIQPEDVQVRILDWDLEGLPPVDMGWDQPFPFSTVPPQDGGFFNSCELENPFPFFPGVPPGGAGPHGGAGPLAAPGLPPHIAAGGPGHLHYICPPPPPPPGLCTYALLGVTPCFFGGGGGVCPAPPLGKILLPCPQGAPCPVPPCPPFIMVIFPCQPPGTGFCIGFYACIGCQGC